MNATLANPFDGVAGMDLNELVQISTAEAHRRAFLKDLTDAFAGFSKPIIAAVVGFAVSPFQSRHALLASSRPRGKKTWKKNLADAPGGFNSWAAAARLPLRYVGNEPPPAS